MEKMLWKTDHPNLYNKPRDQHFVDFQHDIDKKIWLNLQSDVFDHGLLAEFSDFLLENPGLSIQELDRQFRNEWDL